MLKRLDRNDLDRLLQQVAADYRLQVPQLLADGTRQLAAYTADAISLSGSRLQRKPTSCFFPQAGC